jgi:predicted RNA-binding Zn-ribbon protein involved in translation (DUF1610 family)
VAEEQLSTAPPSDIKSRPAYGMLRPVRTARENLIAAEAAGIQAVLRLMGEAPDGFAGRTRLLYAETGSPATHDLDVLRAFGLANIDVVPDPDEALRFLERLLDSATMGTRLYAVGSESFVGQVVHHAITHHIDHKSVITELCGSLARRVQCVHCKHTTEGVTMSFFDCPGCGVTLLVRDHYSRRLAAFQGVSATTEDPDEHPAAEEIYR